MERRILGMFCASIGIGSVTTSSHFEVVHPRNLSRSTIVEHYRWMLTFLPLDTLICPGRRRVASQPFLSGT